MRRRSYALKGQKEVDMSTHIAIARSQGPKAGFNAYMATRVHTAAKRQAEIRSAGNKKQQFAAYCNIFGSQFGVVNGNGAIRSEGQREEVRDNGVVAELRAFAKRLGLNVTIQDDEGDEPVVETPTPSERTIPAAKRISFKMFMSLKKIATAEGATLVCTGKTGGEGTDDPADYALTWNGRKLTPEKASARIAASKA
jgi:hypothetical protein